MKEYPIYRLANYAYKHAFWMYSPLYAGYKMLTDRMERKIIRRLVKPGDCVLDIGANIGFYTRYFSRLVGPAGEIHAFEPDAAHFQRLTQRTGHWPNVHRYHAAVGEKTGTITLYLSDALNVDHRTYPVEEDSRKTVEINCVCLDSRFSEKKVDFIKMDTQGYEYAILQGMQAILQRSANLRMILEFWPAGLRKAGSSPEAVLQLLRDHGFEIYLVSSTSIVRFHESLIRTQGTEYYNLFVTRQPLAL